MRLINYLHLTLGTLHGCTPILLLPFLLTFRNKFDQLRKSEEIGLRILRKFFRDDAKNANKAQVYRETAVLPLAVSGPYCIHSFLQHLLADEILRRYIEAETTAQHSPWEDRTQLGSSVLDTSCVCFNVLHPVELVNACVQGLQVSFFARV